MRREVFMKKGTRSILGAETCDVVGFSVVGVVVELWLRIKIDVGIKTRC